MVNKVDTREADEIRKAIFNREEQDFYHLGSHTGFWVEKERLLRLENAARKYLETLDQIRLRKLR